MIVCLELQIVMSPKTKEIGSGELELILKVCSEKNLYVKSRKFFVEGTLPFSVLLKIVSPPVLFCRSHK